MLLIALRSEYQLMVEPTRNRIFYQNFAPMQTALVLPHYLPDWTAALDEVQPGFHILSDMQVVNRNHINLRDTFRAAEHLIMGCGIGVLAEVLMPGLPTRSYIDNVTIDQTIVVRQFLSIWEAAHFLDYL